MKKTNFILNTKILTLFVVSSLFCHGLRAFAEISKQTVNSLSTNFQAAQSTAKRMNKILPALKLLLEKWGSIPPEDQDFCSSVFECAQHFEMLANIVPAKNTITNIDAMITHLAQSFNNKNMTDAIVLLRTSFYKFNVDCFSQLRNHIKQNIIDPIGKGLFTIEDLNTALTEANIQLTYEDIFDIQEAASRLAYLITQLQ